MKSLCRLSASLPLLVACSGTSDASATRKWTPELASVATCPEGWLRYEPAEVEMNGRLVIAERFGPPNFGETPAADERISVPVLILKAPASVCADTTSDGNDESLSEVDSVQLSGHDSLKKLAGRTLLVRGRLSRAVTGRQYFSIVLAVTSVRER